MTTDAIETTSPERVNILERLQVARTANTLTEVKH